tara:strand:+ start:972 stop:1448 length:477 start_codon:yes stop_codon:yes gene_type:complete
MTTPAAYPSQYQGDYTDYLKAPCDRSGAVRLISDTVTIADATSAGTILGLVPFRKGARLGYGSALYVGDLDTTTNVVLDIGYVYKDNNTSTNINDTDAFVDGSTAGQAGGMISIADDGALAGLNFEATADGWITLTVQAGPVSTAGTGTFNLLVSYDG